MKRTTLFASALALAGCSFFDSPMPKVAPPKPVAQTPVVTPTPTPAPKGDLALVEQPKVDPLVLPHTQPKTDFLAHAREHEKEGDLRMAVELARHALYSSPDDVETLEVLARVSKKAKQWTISELAYGRLADARPDDAQPLINQSRILISMKEWDRAIDAAKRAQARDGSHPEGFHAQGRACLSKGDLGCSISSFEKVVSLSPEHGYALNNLGLAYLRANENENAADVLERASIVLPATAYVQNNLGVAYERLGRKEEAQAAFLTATTLSPKYVKARVNAERMAKAPVQAMPIDEEGDSLDGAHPLGEAP